MRQNRWLELRTKSLSDGVPFMAAGRGRRAVSNLLSLRSDVIQEAYLLQNKLTAATSDPWIPPNISLGVLCIYDTGR